MSDQEARRAHIARAVVALVERDGVRAATVRAVAAEAGIAVGSVRHFLPTQDELRRVALRTTVDAIADRLAPGAPDRVARARGSGTAGVVGASVEILEQVLPLDDVRRREARVHAAYAAETSRDAGIAEILDDAAEQLRALVRHVVASFDELGHLGAGRDTDLETDRLSALIDGLTDHLLTADTRARAEPPRPRRDDLTPERARAVLTTHLHDLTTTRPGSEATPP